MSEVIKTGMSSQCYYQNTCKKYKDNPNCECKFNDVWCDRVARLQQLYNNTLLTDMQKKPFRLIMNEGGEDYEAFQKLALFSKHMDDFVTKGKNLYIHSNICGNGKTSWAIKLMQSYLESCWYKLPPDECQALFINVPRFLIELKNNISEKSEYAQYILNNALTAKLIVWDEIGTKELTTYENEHLLSLINSRLDAGLANIYISNLNRDALLEQLKDRLYSRIVQSSIDIEFNSPNKRGMGVH